MGHSVFLLLVLLWALLSAGWAQANPLPRAAPASVGMTRAGLARLDASMAELVTSGQRAGLVYGVARDGKLVAFAAHGKRDLERDLPMTTDTVFRIYSMSRAVTAAAMLTLVEEGTLGLDEPVARYLPAIGRMQVISQLDGEQVIATAPQRTPMTVRHLFNYTAGFGYARDWPAGLGVQQWDILSLDGTLADMVAKLSRVPLLFQPGAKWYYGFHSDVLGAVAEQASGQSLDRLVHERLLDRIGMADTGFWIQRGDPDRLASIYGANEAGALEPRQALPTSSFQTKGTFFSAGGGLVSTLGDYLRFAQLLLNGGTLDGVRVLEAETVAAMGTNALTEAQGGEVNWYQFRPGASYRGYGWGLAIAVRQPDRPHAVPGSPGDLTWYGLANTYFFVDPVERLVAVAMSQYVGPGAAEQDFRLRRGVYAALQRRRSGESGAARQSR